MRRTEIASAERAHEECEHERDQRERGDRLDDDSTQEPGECQHGYRGADQSEHWQEPRRQLAEHDLGVGEIGDQHVGERPRARSTQISPAVAAGANEEDQDKLHGRDAVVDGLAERCQQPDRAEPRGPADRVDHAVEHDCKCEQQPEHEQRPQGVKLPAPGGGDGLMNENGPGPEAKWHRRPPCGDAHRHALRSRDGTDNMITKPTVRGKLSPARLAILINRSVKDFGLPGRICNEQRGARTPRVKIET